MCFCCIWIENILKSVIFGKQRPELGLESVIFVPICHNEDLNRSF